MGRRAALVDGDVFRRPSCESVVERAVAAPGRIDVLVSNPAFSRGPTSSTTTPRPSSG